jgi:hypothetical protein
MEYIVHRRNTKNLLLDTDKKYGIEIDLRSYKNEIILHHDPFKEGHLFNDWIKHYDHGTLILNVKEEGLEIEVESVLKKACIENYFFLDQSFPFLIYSANRGQKNCAVRYSEFESIETVLSLSKKISWVWVDCFTKYILDYQTSKILNDNGFRICLVSPELQGRDSESEIITVAKTITEQNIFVDAICTKIPNLWEKAFQND